MKKTLLLLATVILLTGCVTMGSGSLEYLMTAPASSSESNDLYWRATHWVDEFGDYDYTDPCVIGHFKGTFSNSATSSSPCDIFIYIDKKGKASFGIFEYSMNAAYFLSSAKAAISLKVGNEIDKLDSIGRCYGNRVSFMNRAGMMRMYQALVENDSVELRISVNEGITSTYRCTVYSNGFINACQSAFEKE